MEKNAPHGLYDIPFQSVECQKQNEDRVFEAFNTKGQKETTALGLLASAYGNSSDSEEDQVDPDRGGDDGELNVMNHLSGSRSQKEISSLSSHFQDHHVSAVRVHDLPLIGLGRGDNIPSKSIYIYEDYMHQKVKCKTRSQQTFDYSVELKDYDISSRVAYENMTAVPHSTLNCSRDVHDTKTSMFGNARAPIHNKSASLLPPSDEDSSRMHVFCLEHAVEVEQQLHPIGGAHILLLCHPDYPKIEAEAKFVAEELGIDLAWKNIAYRHATKEDEERIQSSLDSEEAIPGNGDWAVKLGINLFYSANLSRSPLYSKQMPYNSVIYYAFGCSSPANSPKEPKVYQRRANKQKKVVAGKWCGKVWMSNQVHPLLAKREPEDGDDDKRLHGWSLPDETIERSESTLKNKTSRKSSRKRKITVENRGAWKATFAERDLVSDSSFDNKPTLQQRRNVRSKQARYVERDDAASEGNYSSLQHHRKPTRKQTRCFESDAASDDSLDDNSHMQHRKNIVAKEAKFFDNEVVSDDTMDYDSERQQRGEFSCKQVKDAKRDVMSEDSLGGCSLKLHSKTPKRKQAKYIAKEDVTSNNQMEDQFQQQTRIPKSRQTKCLSGEDLMMSDDQLEYLTQKQQRRIPKSRQAKYLAGDISYGQLEGHSLKYQSRIPKRRRAKRIVKEDVMSDDHLEDHTQKQQRSAPRSRQNTRVDRGVMDDSTENNSRLLHRTPKRKQAKCIDEDNIKSYDQIDDDCHQHGRILRSKQSKSETLQQVKQANPCSVKKQTSRTMKHSARQLVKPKASKQMKQSPHVRNDHSDNSGEFSLHIEDGDKGGPSTRLRKRVPKVLEESEAKSKGKQTTKKNGKNATAVKVAKVKEEEADYQCDIEGCTMSFGSKQELVLHKRNVCPVKDCGKKFFSHKYLVQHRRVHMDDRPLKCPWKGCKMTFKWAWARTEHIRVHTGARPYVCAEPGCGQTFRFVSDFSRHKRKTGHSAKKSR